MFKISFVLIAALGLASCQHKSFRARTEPVPIPHLAPIEGPAPSKPTDATPTAPVDAPAATVATPVAPSAPTVAAPAADPLAVHEAPVIAAEPTTAPIVPAPDVTEHAPVPAAITAEHKDVKELLEQHADLVAVINLAGDLRRVKTEAELDAYVANLDALEQTENALVRLDDRYEEHMKTQGHRARIANNRIVARELRATLSKPN